MSGTSGRPRRASSPAAGARWRRRRRAAAGGARRRCARSAAGRRPARCRCRRRRRRTTRASGGRRSRLSSLEIHFESPVSVATLPSRVIADLKSTHGRPVRACLRKAWFCRRARCGELAVGDVDLDALVAQDAQAAAGGLLGRVVAGDDDALDAGREDRVGARRRAPSWQHGSSETYIVAPRRSASPAAAIALTSACGPPYSLVPALAEDLAVADDDRADDRVGAARCPSRARRARSPARGARGRSRCAAAWTIESSLRERASAAALRR